jgi:hypothetical protein
MKRLGMGVLLWVVPGLVLAAGTVEQIAAHKHLGVASCASSVCHGATQAFKESNVMQNEFALWQEFDPHATKAWQALGSAEGQAIARKLGLGDATTAKVCLDCHADNVPADKRGEKFQIADGVGCEACHGGSELWISSHAEKSATHADNLAKGLYPTEDPLRRAELCLSCHMGTTDRMITHRIMGAGHPRLSFELDTFTWLNPHYQVDADYEARKGSWNGVRDWAVGQGVAAANLLEVLLDERTGFQGIFPELVLFDCHACHKPMSAGKWAPRQGTGLGPGVVRLNDANLVMFRIVLGVVDRGASERLLQQTRSLHQSTLRDRAATLAAARALHGTLREVLPRVAAFDYGAGALEPILAGVVADAERGEYRDFAAAEQAAMAVQSVVVAFKNAGALDEARSKTLQTRLDTLYATVDREDAYAMGPFLSALREVRAAAR